MQVAQAEEDQVRQSRSTIEALEPQGQPDRELVFEGWIMPDGRPTDRRYTQAQLGMFPAQEFVTMITEIIDGFVEGDMGLKIGDLFRGDIAMPAEMNAEAVDGVVQENLQLIKAFVKLVQLLPEFQLDVICLSLGVPRRERKWVKECLVEPPHRGGLTVDDGFDILKVFIQQNALLLKETFLGKAKELVEVFQLEVLGQTEDEDESKASTASSTSNPSPSEETFDSPGGTPSNTSFMPTPAND